MKIEKNIKSKFNIKTNDNKTINVNSDSLISVIQSLQTDEIKFSVNATRNDAFTLLIDWTLRIKCFKNPI